MASTTSVSAKDMGGLKIINLGNSTTGTDAANQDQVTTARDFAISRANHTGTQVAATISDFDTQVRTTKPEQLSPPAAPFSMNGQTITNQADPSTGTDGATKSYVDAQVSGLVSGQVIKGSVRAAASSNVTIASPGTTIDGLTASNGDIFLLTAQSNGTENGPYVFNGSAAAMTRATNWNSDAEAVRGSYWVVLSGTNADKFALLTNDTAITLGTTTPTFSFISSPAAVANGYTTTSPSVAAGGTWTVTHNLSSRYVLVQVARVTSPYDVVDVRIERTTTNTLSILPDVAMASGEYEVMVYKVV